MSEKPLGHKSYGSIPHIPGSRLGPGDHHCTEGQARIATEKPRDKYDLIIIQEKVDGSNVAVAKINGEIIPLTRAGYHANTSNFQQHHYFSKWVAKRWALFNELLAEGERICGEWMLQAHGTRYDITDPDCLFVAFDIMTGQKRLPVADVTRRLKMELVLPHIYSEKPMKPEVILERANMCGPPFGFHGSKERIEGLVYRVERKGIVDFLCKYVRPDKIDGKYLETDIWNFDPEKI